MGRLIGEPGTTTVERLKKAHFDRLAKRFDAALLRAIPTLSQRGTGLRQDVHGGFVALFAVDAR